MKFSAAAVLAVVAGASAWENVTYTTEVVTALTTYCPAATTLTHGGETYTVTSATTLTITNCPCTITKPVTTSSSVICHTCSAASSAPVYTNGTTAAAPTTVATSKSTAAVGTGSVTPSASATSLPTAGAGKTAAISGAGLAGLMGIAAFFL